MTKQEDYHRIYHELTETKQRESFLYTKVLSKRRNLKIFSDFLFKNRKYLLKEYDKKVVILNEEKKPIEREVIEDIKWDPEDWFDTENYEGTAALYFLDRPKKGSGLFLRKGAEFTFEFLKKKFILLRIKLSKEFDPESNNFGESELEKDLTLEELLKFILFLLKYNKTTKKENDARRKEFSKKPKKEKGSPKKEKKEENESHKKTIPVHKYEHKTRRKRK